MKYDYKIYPSLLDKFEYYKTGKFNTTKQDLLDSINRVPFQTKDQVEKGKAFHTLTEDLNKLHDIIKMQPDPNFIKVGFWNFPTNIALQIAEERHGGKHEVLLEKSLDVPGVGKVLLYGKIDTLKNSIVYDLKTTSRYNGWRYLNSPQKDVYLYISDCKEMIFSITDFRSVYPENYFPDQELEQRVVSRLYEFIIWLEDNHTLITDKKIFGLKN